MFTPELEEAWRVSTHQGISIWGHTPVDEGIVDRLGNLRQAAVNLRHPEITVLGCRTGWMWRLHYE